MLQALLDCLKSMQLLSAWIDSRILATCGRSGSCFCADPLWQTPGSNFYVRTISYPFWRENSINQNYFERDQELGRILVLARLE